MREEYRRDLELLVHLRELEAARLGLLKAK